MPVAILTDPRGAGAGGDTTALLLSIRLLRSSPTPEGRCWMIDYVFRLSGIPPVAILTDPGGPVLVSVSWDFR